MSIEHERRPLKYTGSHSGTLYHGRSKEADICAPKGAPRASSGRLFVRPLPDQPHTGGLSLMPCRTSPSAQTIPVSQCNRSCRGPQQPEKAPHRPFCKSPRHTTGKFGWRGHA
ncbi:hypothetical protein THTE_1065 [Thermogutta terrifontis]|uniref:Uncharacterized protein n=1 Tax=Thermogutta terrifontis TaxID=1331910 RepID=A0A286RCN1_9BACT|nr:hypothetical protein THTE_1065 [Thermogutta terrifontis]